MNDNYRIRELEQLIHDIKLEQEKTITSISELEFKEQKQASKLSKYNLELKELKSNQKFNELEQQFLSQNPHAKYLGLANGETETIEGNILASCYKCTEKLKLYSIPTGIGSMIIGMCPKCGHITDFTNYSMW